MLVEALNSLKNFMKIVEVINAFIFVLLVTGSFCMLLRRSNDFPVVMSTCLSWPSLQAYRGTVIFS